MSNLFMRNTEVIIGTRKWNSPPLDIEFNVKFDTDSIPNEAECTIYNLSQDSINNIKKGLNITINAGYGGDIGTILNGVVTDVKTERSGLDIATKIKALNVTGQYLNRWVHKVYKAGTTADFIIKDLLMIVGIKPNQLSLQENVVYKRGFNATGKIKDVVNTIVRQCKSRLIIRNTAIIITTKDKGIDEGFLLNKKTGLINVEVLDKSDSVATHSVEMLLNHAINPYTILKVESSKLNGMVLVIEGEHSSDFTTKCEVRVL